MATQQECEQGVDALIARLHSVDPELRKKYAVNRTISLRVPDLGVVFLATLDGDEVGSLRCLSDLDTHGAQVRVTTDSDDLIALMAGELAPAVAWATGKLRVEASMLDLLRLRSLL